MDGALESLLKDIQRTDIVIPLDVDDAHLLFQVASESYKARSHILTANIKLNRWIADERPAAASVGKIAHRGRPIELNGPSGRMDAALMLEKDGD